MELEMVPYAALLLSTPGDHRAPDDQVYVEAAAEEAEGDQGKGIGEGEEVV